MLRIKQAHGALWPDGTKREHHLPRLVHHCWQIAKFVLRKISKHKIHLLALGKIIAHTKPQAGILLRAQNQLNVF